MTASNVASLLMSDRVERELEASSLYDDERRISAELRIGAEFVRRCGVTVRRCLNLACGPALHHLLGWLRLHDPEHLLGIDVSDVFVEMLRSLLAAQAAQTPSLRLLDRVSVQQGDMRTVEPAGEGFDLVGLYGNSFGYFPDADNRAVLARVRRLLRPGGAAVITIPRFSWVSSHTRAAPLEWIESAQTSIGPVRARGRRYFDPELGYSVGRYELEHVPTRERAVVSELISRVYPFDDAARGDRRLPTLQSMAREAGFASAALEPIPDEDTRRALGLMSQMDCLLLRA